MKILHKANGFVCCEGQELKVRSQKLEEPPIQRSSSHVSNDVSKLCWQFWKEETIVFFLRGLISNGDDLVETNQIEPPKMMGSRSAMSQDKVMGSNLLRYAFTERNILSYIQHPYIVTCQKPNHWTPKSESFRHDTWWHHFSTKWHHSGFITLCLPNAQAFGAKLSEAYAGTRHLNHLSNAAPQKIGVELRTSIILHHVFFCSKLKHMWQHAKIDHFTTFIIIFWKLKHKVSIDILVKVLVMQYCPGGNLQQLIRRLRSLDEKTWQQSDGSFCFFSNQQTTTDNIFLLGCFFCNISYYTHLFLEDPKNLRSCGQIYALRSTTQLFFLGRKLQGLSNALAQLYSAELLLALQHLHERSGEAACHVFGHVLPNKTW